jgi:hypothetical protein
MKWRALLLAALLAGCGALPAPVDTARLPPGEFASGDPDLAAVSYAAAAFSDQASTYGEPAAGAEAVLAVEYIAGAMNTEPRWATLDPDIQGQLLRARALVREAIGVAPNAPSQAVVDALATARRALQNGDRAEAAAAFHPPVFTLPPDKTIEALANLPYMQPVNVAVLRAEDAVSGVPAEPSRALDLVPSPSP